MNLSLFSENGLVLALLCTVLFQKLLQAADRRDRLIYVLSQINAARGEDAMHVDESSDDSEEEVNGPS